MTDTGHDTTAHALDLRLFPIAGAQVSALVLPGCGFREHTDHDGIGYAHWLNRIGISAAVLHYRLRPDPFPLALQQARAALALLQQSSDDGFCGTSVGVIGSSAGGLLAGLLATGAVLSVEDTPGDVPRPDFQAQCYGLADLGLLPEAAVQALLADRVDLARELSPVSHVDAQTCPSFIWATAADPPGLPNVLAWTSTLAEHGVPVELHIYPQGRHGVGLADGVAYGAHDHERIPHTAQWTEAFERWVRHSAADHLATRAQRRPRSRLAGGIRAQRRPRHRAQTGPWSSSCHGAGGMPRAQVT